MRNPNLDIPYLNITIAELFKAGNVLSDYY